MSSVASTKNSLGIPIRSALSRFFRWWLAELAFLVPSAARNWWIGDSCFVVIRFDANKLIVQSREDGLLQEVVTVNLESGTVDSHRSAINAALEKIAGKDRQILLALPDDYILRRVIELPEAVEENLCQSIGFDLDRLTPFKSEQAYFDASITARNQPKQKIIVELQVCHRLRVEPLIARAQELGLSVSGIVPLGQDGTSVLERRLNLSSRAALSPESHRQRQWWRWGLAVLAACLFLAWLAVPIWQKRNAAISLITPLAEAKTAAHEVDRLRDRLNRLVAEHNRLLDKKWGIPSTLVVLDGLSRLLTDDTYVVEFTFDGKTIQLQGESASSANLVEAIEKSPLFKEVGFKSQLTKLAGTSVDRFHIGATIEDDAKLKPAVPAENAPSPPPPPDTTKPAIAPAGSSVIVVPSTTAKANSAKVLEGRR